ncbi:MAG: endolytic transglycosylase MltG [Acidiferrobacterales bacterium]
MTRLFRSTIVIGVAAAIGAGGYLTWAWNRGLPHDVDSHVVNPGTPLRTFARELYREGLLPDRYSLIMLAYLRGHSRRLKAGEYRFAKGITQYELLDQVVAGRVIEYPLALIEGWTFEQFLHAIREAPKMTSTLSDLGQQEIMARLGHPDLHPEGQFFPDTYYYSAGTTDLALLRRAFERMQTRLQGEWEGRAPELPLDTPYQALTLASIVEKETGHAGERRLVAGVFLNRLRIGMRLQSDPTVIYGMGSTFDGNLRRRDLERDSPYSTYTRRGLPPTPIAMPGGDALHAVLHPEETDALYFVARGDGTHHFSETLQQHNEAVIKYQLGGKRRRFSSYSTQK